MTAWMNVARSLVGTREVPGGANNPTIMTWGNKLGAKVLGVAYGADSVPWCGLFAAWCVSQAGFKPPPIAIRAKAWASWGVPLQRAVEGAALVFEREGGGHVGFYVAEDATHYHVLGGNQGDAVSIVRIAKTRCIAIRWPAGAAVSTYAKRVAGVGAVSTNEA